MSISTTIKDYYEKYSKWVRLGLCILSMTCILYYIFIYRKKYANQQFEYMQQFLDDISNTVRQQQEIIRQLHLQQSQIRSELQSTQNQLALTLETSADESKVENVTENSNTKQTSSQPPKTKDVSTDLMTHLQKASLLPETFLNSAESLFSGEMPHIRIHTFVPTTDTNPFQETSGNVLSLSTLTPILEEDEESDEEMMDAEIYNELRKIESELKESATTSSESSDSV